MRTYPDKFVDAGIDWYEGEPEFPESAETKRVNKKFQISGDGNKEHSNKTLECIAAAKRGQKGLSDAKV